MAESESRPVQHDPDRGRFYVDLGTYEAVLMYGREGDVLDFYHIYVPDPYRGQGLAGRILRTAFDYAQAQGLTVAVSCPFIAGDFLPRFPQYQGVVRSGRFPFAG